MKLFIFLIFGLLFSTSMGHSADPLAEAGFYKESTLPEAPQQVRGLFAASVELETEFARCSGAMISPDGYVLTAAHCIWDCLVEQKKARRYRTESAYTVVSASPTPGISCPIRLRDYGATTARVELLGRAQVLVNFELLAKNRDEDDAVMTMAAFDEDFAVLKFQLPRAAACVPLAPARPNPGERVWALGYPSTTVGGRGKFEALSGDEYISYGRVFERLSDLALDSSEKIRGAERFFAANHNAYLFTSADIYTGSSGGMLANPAGELVGTVSQQICPQRSNQLTEKKSCYNNYIDGNMQAISAHHVFDRAQISLGQGRADQIFGCRR